MTGEKMRELRKLAGMSQAEIASAIGMVRETIGQMERGQAPIEPRTALAVELVCRMVLAREAIKAMVDSGAGREEIEHLKADILDLMIAEVRVE